MFSWKARGRLTAAVFATYTATIEHDAEKADPRNTPPNCKGEFMEKPQEFQKQLFEPHEPHLSEARRRSHKLHEIAYTLVDFSAALMFIIGSIFFFYPDLQTQGTWLFLIGSILFGAKPTIRLSRELADLRLQRAPES